MITTVRSFKHEPFYLRGRRRGAGGLYSRYSTVFTCIIKALASCMAAAFLCSFWNFLNAKSVGFWGSAPDPDGGAPIPPSWAGGVPPSRTLPGAAPLAPPLLLSPSDATVGSARWWLCMASVGYAGLLPVQCSSEGPYVRVVGPVALLVI